MAATVVAIFIPRLPAAAIALLSMVSLYFSRRTDLGGDTFLFWCGACALAILIQELQPKTVANSKAGVPFISGGALVGMSVGMVANSSAAIIIGAVAGALFGALAFSNTAKGRPMNFPSAKFFNYTAAKGLPAAVALSCIGVCIVKLLNPLQ